jgi:hypothetical protein
LGPDRSIEIRRGRGNGIGAAGAQALSGLVHLTSLDLSDNGIGAAGAQALASLVNLTSLGLGDNGIEAAGVQALKGHVHLTDLDLSNRVWSIDFPKRHNGIGDEGTQALAGFINLTSLDLFGNGIGCAWKPRRGADALSATGLTRRSVTPCQGSWIVSARAS